jgi:hypothetical protein
MNSSTTSKVLLALLLAASATACGSATDGPSSIAGQDEAEDDSPPTSSAVSTQAEGPAQATDLSGPGAPSPASAGAEAPAEAPATPAAPAATDLDEDGVRMLLPSAAGTNIRLGTSDPNATAGFLIENKVVATPQTLGSLHYWNTAAFAFDYTAGGSGKTARVHMIGGEQKYTWRTQSGFLSAPSDLKNQEYTAYVRIHDIFDAGKAMVTMKIRGGKHIAGNGDLASCTMMTLSPSGNTMFGKELTHPSYDYVKLTPQFAASLKDNQWIGMKLVSYSMPSDPKKVVNQLYLDTTPFDADGKPLNGWRLFSEYIDSESKSTGQYSKLADWGGEQTTIRTDGVSSIDFALVGAREITPPN